MTRDMRPYRENDTAVVPDDVAARMVAAGEAVDARPWPRGEAGETSKVPPAAKQYKTKGI